MTQTSGMNVTLQTFGKGVFAGDFGVVEFEGNRYKYGLALTDEWKDADDYLDNVATDFENEHRCGIETTELFHLID